MARHLTMKARHVGGDIVRLVHRRRIEKVLLAAIITFFCFVVCIKCKCLTTHRTQHTDSQRTVAEKQPIHELTVIKCCLSRDLSCINMLVLCVTSYKKEQAGVLKDIIGGGLQRLEKGITSRPIETGRWGQSQLNNTISRKSSWGSYFESRSWKKLDHSKAALWRI